MYEVKKSPIHARGLSSTGPIAAHTVLGHCRSRPARDANSRYVLWVGRDPVEVLCKLKYINHSSRPNVAYYDDLSVVTLRAIGRGEEFTHNYCQWPRDDSEPGTCRSRVALPGSRAVALTEDA
jgi:hypothetical protein